MKSLVANQRTGLYPNQCEPPHRRICISMLQLVNSNSGHRWAFIKGVCWFDRPTDTKQRFKMYILSIFDKWNVFLHLVNFARSSCFAIKADKLHRLYYGLWCPGSAKSQCISSHDIDLVRPKHSSPSWENWWPGNLNNHLTSSNSLFVWDHTKHILRTDVTPTPGIGLVYHLIFAYVSCLLIHIL